MKGATRANFLLNKLYFLCLLVSLRLLLSLAHQVVLGQCWGPHKQSSEQDVEKTELFQASDAKWNSNTGHKEISI